MWTSPFIIPLLPTAALPPRDTSILAVPLWASSLKVTIDLTKIAISTLFTAVHPISGQVLMTSMIDFQSGQILCLEHENTCLYAELIQIAHNNKSRRGWVRPLFLKVFHTGDPIAASSASVDNPIGFNQFSLYDLRQGADLLCPIALFRAALDTEVVPLLTRLANSRTQPDSDRLAHKQLHRFICDVCQVHSSVL